MPKKGGRAATAGAASKAKASGASAARRARTPLPEALSPSNDSYFALLTSDDEADSLEVQTQRASRVRMITKPRTRNRPPYSCIGRSNEAARPFWCLDDEEETISTGDAVAAMEEPDNESGIDDSQNEAGAESADEVQVGASVDHAMEVGYDGDAEGDFSVSSIPEKHKTRKQPGVQTMPAPMSAKTREPARPAARGRFRERPGDEDRPQHVRHRRQPGASAIGKAPVTKTNLSTYGTEGSPGLVP
mmetsp:Transcript_17196/g.39628  ORF Transcript_17196/g.39628 Transcript_17196/m.39628 type:complete len:246 (+) Transcript_17196:163-900(+)